MSVLHHLPDPDELFHFSKENLKPGGQLVIWHEPNKRFANNFWLKKYSEMSKKWYHFKRQFKSKKMTMGGNENGSISQKVYNELIVQGIIDSEDSQWAPGRIQEIVDYHSPTATNQINPDKGFDPIQFEKIHPQFVLKKLEVTSHLGKLSVDKPFRKIAEKVFAKLFPYDGLVFGVVLEKV